MQVRLTNATKLFPNAFSKTPYCFIRIDPPSYYSHETREDNLTATQYKDGLSAVVV